MPINLYIPLFSYFHIFERYDDLSRTLLHFIVPYAVVTSTIRLRGGKEEGTGKGPLVLGYTP